ncbi:MAG: hypothetical protein QOJ65_2624 [Fimbriimonadaceae bacterium]|jgi:hypothetical protein|nr:hypothetical protein [Fimbriimonadaceae bacterium]
MLVDGTNEDRPFPFTRLDVLIAACLFILGLVTYIRTLAPDVLYGDSGEFQVLAATGGLAHATGYPIYLLMARVFTWLPFGTLAWKVNLLSAILACSAIGKVFLIARSLGVRRVFAIVGAVVLLINPLFWWQSIIAEVYTASADFFIGAVLCAVIWRKSRDPRWLAAGGLLGGLCLGLHHTAVLALLSILVYLALAKPGKQDWTLALGGIGAGVALALAAYMVMGSIDNVTTSTNSVRPSASAYGLKMEDFDTPTTRVKFVMTARQWSGELFRADSSRIGKNWETLKQETLNDLGWVVPLIALVGVGVLLAFKRTRPEGVLFLLSLIILLGFSLTHRAFDIEVDFLTAYVVMSALLAVGLQAIQDLVFKKPLQQPGSRLATAAAGLAVVVISTWPVISGALSAFSEAKATFLTEDRRKLPYPVDSPTDAHDYGRAVVDSLEGNALVITRWEHEWPSYYVAQFEANKPGMEFIEANPEGTKGKLADSMRAYIRESIAKRPVYATGVLRSLINDYDFYKVPLGYDLYQLRPR